MGKLFLGNREICVSDLGKIREISSFELDGTIVKDMSGINLIGDEFSNVTIIKKGGLSYVSHNNPNLTGTLDFSNLVTVEEYGLYYAFYRCTNLTGTLDFSNLVTIERYGLTNAFYKCTNLTVPTNLIFSNLTTIGVSALQEAFSNNLSIINITFPLLNNLGGMCFWGTFQGCTNLENIYFNAINSDSFSGYKSHLDNMLSGTGTEKTHTLHFPSNLDPQTGSTVISSLNGYPNFGGSSSYVILLYDLPATE